MFVCLNVLWTTSSLSNLTSKSTFNSSNFRLSVDTVSITNTTGRADAIKTALASNNDLKFLETGYLSKNISTDTGTVPERPQYFLTTLQLGQLGNNMFQYAGLLGLAKMNGRMPFFPLSSLVRQVFKISHVDTIKEASTWKRLPEANHGKYEPFYEHLPEGNLTLAAYLQSYKYFQAIEKEVRQEFQFREGIQRRAMGLIKFLRPKIGTRTPIGVHVRRFDLLTQKEVKLGSLTAPKSYFQQAFAWMRSRHGDVVFLVATDDPSWCKENILQGDDVILLPHATADVHLCALAACRHVVMSVGTFGWWAGWLGGGDVIYYTKPHAPGSPKDKGFSKDDFFPLHWIGIGDDSPTIESPQLQQNLGQQIQTSGLGVYNTTGELALTKQTVGLPGLQLQGGGSPVAGQQNIAPGIAQSQVSSNGLTLGQPIAASRPNYQVLPNQLLPSQQNVATDWNSRISAMTNLSGQDKTAPVLSGQGALNIQASPDTLQQMLKNQGLLQSAGSEQNTENKSFQYSPAGNAIQAPVVQQNDIGSNVLLESSRVNVDSKVENAGPGGLVANPLGGQGMTNPSETQQAERSVVLPEGDSKSFANAMENANTFKPLVNAAIPVLVANNLQKSINQDSKVMGNVDLTTAGKETIGFADTTKIANVDVKSNPSVSDQTVNLSPDALKAILSGTELGESLKFTPSINSMNSVDPKLALNKSSPLFENGGYQVLEKPGHGETVPLPMSGSLGTAEQPFSGQQVENKQTASLP
ncbi:galactoside 2-alpha-L-fucosyltransferase [Elysia marginata]|uniref:L-Fucosyltransferase n=1 Tax=Elysia marginata TaxID=1093978 RepID=A0AAV4IQN0_9GAST|nr:galactoside 2-alpha-L-fucosyltransferase [Elysia marginata]